MDETNELTARIEDVNNFSTTPFLQINSDFLLLLYSGLEIHKFSFSKTLPELKRNLILCYLPLLMVEVNTTLPPFDLLITMNNMFLKATGLRTLDSKEIDIVKEITEKWEQQIYGYKSE